MDRQATIRGVEAIGEERYMANKDKGGSKTKKKAPAKSLKEKQQAKKAKKALRTSI